MVFSNKKAFTKHFIRIVKLCFKEKFIDFFWLFWQMKIDKKFTMLSTML